nr:protein-disulfide reductase DsbD N-terminal domain-containing protein [Candidatus Coxiella mudrowiae]
MWQIKPRFYIYRNRISFDSLKSTEDHLGQPLWPEANATIKDYPGLGKLPVYSGLLKIPIPIIKSSPSTPYLQINYQGCLEQGYCYPPTSKTIVLNLAGNYMQPTYPLPVDIAPDKTISFKKKKLHLPPNKIK